MIHGVGGRGASLRRQIMLYVALLLGVVPVTSAMTLSDIDSQIAEGQARRIVCAANAAERDRSAMNQRMVRAVRGGGATDMRGSGE